METIHILSNRVSSLPGPVSNQPGLGCRLQWPPWSGRVTLSDMNISSGRSLIFDPFGPEKGLSWRGDRSAHVVRAAAQSVWPPRRPGFLSGQLGRQPCICPDDRWTIQDSRELECHFSGRVFAIIWLYDMAPRSTTTQEKENKIQTTQHPQEENSLLLLSLKSKQLLPHRLSHWQKCSGGKTTVNQLRRTADLKVMVRLICFTIFITDILLKLIKNLFFLNIEFKRKNKWPQKVVSSFR